MVTRSKSGISKKKVFLSTKHPPQLPCTPYYHETEPSSFTAASKSLVWRQAMAEEFSALQRQGTWSLVPNSPDKHVVGCRWVFKIKHNPDGSVARHKARLVAKGFHQEFGVDYTETFSPVVKQATVRIVLTLAVHFHWPLHQLDVTNAFLHGILKEDIYMTQPQGFIDPTFPSHLCKLHKSLYGLKQAPRAWYERFSNYLFGLGFQSTYADPSLFIRHFKNTVTLILLYVDDLIITGSDSTYITYLISQLGLLFEMKNLGQLHHFLGIEVSTTSTGLFLSQTKYAKDLLLRTSMLDCKPVGSPCSSKQSPTCTTSPLMKDPALYRSIAGALQYLTLTRPDLAFAVNLACQYMHSPTEAQFVALKRILRYIKGTLSYGLHIRDGPLRLSAFSDADWAGDTVDRRSTTGFCVFFGQNPVSWCAKKQHTVARSSTESEYRSLAHTAAELSWLQILFKDIGFFLSTRPLIWCDNISAISLASNPVFHARTKHIEVDYHFVRERVLRKDLDIRFVSTQEQVADIFTKGLHPRRFQFLRSKLWVADRPLSLRGPNSTTVQVTEFKSPSDLCLSVENSSSAAIT